MKNRVNTVKRTEKKIRPTVNLERSTREIYETIPIEDFFTKVSGSDFGNISLSDLIGHIRNITGEENPIITLQHLDYSNGFTIEHVKTVPENDAEYEARVLKEQQAQKRFDGIKRNEVDKAKATLAKYGISV